MNQNKAISRVTVAPPSILLADLDPLDTSLKVDEGELADGPTPGTASASRRRGYWIPGRMLTFCLLFGLLIG